MAAPLDRVKALLATLPREDQAELKRYLADILVTEDEAAQIHVASLQATRGGRTVTYTFRQERIRCGKKGCHCEESPRHGPYTYKYWREDGRLRKAYVGRAGAAATRPGGKGRAARARGSSAPSSSDPPSPA